MALSDIMDGLAALVPGGLAQNVYAWPVDSVTVPCVVVGYPDNIDFDVVFGDGPDQWSIPLWFVVGRTTSKAARDVLSGALDGINDIKAALNGVQSFGTVNLTVGAIEEVSVADAKYISLRLTAEVTA